MFFESAQHGWHQHLFCFLGRAPVESTVSSSSLGSDEALFLASTGCRFVLRWRCHAAHRNSMALFSRKLACEVARSGISAQSLSQWLSRRFLKRSLHGSMLTLLPSPVLQCALFFHLLYCQIAFWNDIREWDGMSWFVFGSPKPRTNRSAWTASRASPGLHIPLPFREVNLPRDKYLHHQHSRSPAAGCPSLHGRSVQHAAVS